MLTIFYIFYKRRNYFSILDTAAHSVSAMAVMQPDNCGIVNQ